MTEYSKWLGGKAAGAYIGYSRDWVEVRAVPWPKDGLPVPSRIRFKINSENGDRRYYVPDLEVFLVTP